MGECCGNYCIHYTVRHNTVQVTAKYTYTQHGRLGLGLPVRGGGWYWYVVASNLNSMFQVRYRLRYTSSGHTSRVADAVARRRRRAVQHIRHDITRGGPAARPSGLCRVCLVSVCLRFTTSHATYPLPASGAPVDASEPVDDIFMDIRLLAL